MKIILLNTNKSTKGLESLVGKIIFKAFHFINKALIRALMREYIMFVHFSSVKRKYFAIVINRHQSPLVFEIALQCKSN